MKTRIKILLLTFVCTIILGCGEATIVDPAGLINTNSTGGSVGVPESIEVSVLLDQMGVGTIQPGSVSGTFSDGSSSGISSGISWSSSDPSVATVSPAGVITGVGAGTVVITGTVDGVSSSATIEVLGVTSLSATVPSSTLAVGDAAAITVSALYTDGTSAFVNSATTYSSSNPSVATVSPSGEIIAVSAGNTTITATIDGVSTSIPLTITGNTTSTTPPPGAAGPGLIFSEIGSGNTGFGFWVEIYNATANAVDLSDYGIRGRNIDNLGEETHSTFPLPSRSVPAGGYVVVMTDDIAGFTDVLSYAGNPNVVILNGANYSWLGSGYLELMQAGATADFVRFGSNTQAPVTASAWTSGAAPQFSTLDFGESLARDVSNSDTNSPADWTKSTYASLGGPNDITCAVDADNDGIPDCSEVPGSTYAGMDLYAMGARTNQIDLFVQIDHMDPTARPGESVLGMVPQREALDKVVESFLEQNIHVHFDVGDLIDQNPGIDPLDYDLGGGQVVPFAEQIEVSEFNFNNAKTPGAVDLLDYKAQYLAVERRSFFYYMLFAYAQFPFDPALPQGSSGISELDGNDSMVSMGSWGFDRSTPAKTNELINSQGATLMHEFGHALGLHHGGAINDAENFKPNYLSVMSYLYTLLGLPTLGVNGNEGDRYFNFPFFANGPCFVARTDLVNGPFDDYNDYKIGFSDGTSMDLDEVNGLNEALGLGRPDSGPVDWNCDGDTDDIVTNWDTNNGSLSTMSDHDDWGNLRFFFASDASNRIANGVSGNGASERLDVFIDGGWQEHKGFVKEPTYYELLEAQSRFFESQN